MNSNDRKPRGVALEAVEGPHDLEPGLRGDVVGGVAHLGLEDPRSRGCSARCSRVIASGHRGEPRREVSGSRRRHPRGGETVAVIEDRLRADSYRTSVTKRFTPGAKGAPSSARWFGGIRAETAHAVTELARDS